MPKIGWARSVAYCGTRRQGGRDRRANTGHERFSKRIVVFVFRDEPGFVGSVVLAFRWGSDGWGWNRGLGAGGARCLRGKWGAGESGLGPDSRDSVVGNRKI